MLNIALFGPPGAGKGTQSEFLVKEFNLFYISTGDLLRKELAAETRLGLEAKSIIASGGLVSDEIIVQVIEKTITEHPEVPNTNRACSSNHDGRFTHRDVQPRQHR